MPVQKEINRKLLCKISPNHFSITRQDNLHFTLCFLGNLTRDQIFSLPRVVQTHQFQPFLISFDGVGQFQQRVLYAKAGRGEREIYQLAAAIKQQLGFNPDKNFVSHATLCRNKRAYAKLFERTKSELGKNKLNATFWCDRIHLMESKEENGVRTYHPRHVFPLSPIKPVGETTQRTESNAVTILSQTTVMDLL